METAELELLPIEEAAAAPDGAEPTPELTEVAQAAGQAIDLKKLDLEDVALAKFGDWRSEQAAVAKQINTLALDVSTQTKIDEAKSLRQRLINAPRAEANKIADALASKLTKTSKRVRAEQAAIVAGWDKTAEPITKTIDDGQAALDAKRAEEARLEQERKDTLNAAVLRIYGYVKAATGMPAERIAAGIAYVEKMAFGPEWQEYKERAEEAKGEVLVQLRQLHADAIEADRLRAENEAQKAELDAIDAINDFANDCVVRGSAYIEMALQEFDADVVPTLPQVPRVLALVPVARARMEMLLAEAKAREAKPAPAPAPAVATVTTSAGTVADASTGEVLSGPTTDTSEVQPPQQVLKAEPAPQPADATDRSAAATASPGVGPMGAGQPADAGPAGEAEEATFKLGDINAKLGFTMTGAFVGGTLDIAANKTERGALWYTTSRVGAIKRALLAHIEQAL